MITIMVNLSSLCTGSRGDVFVVRTSIPVENLGKMDYFDRVTVSSHILYTANQETEGSQDRLTVYILQDCLLLLLFFRSYALFKSPGQKKVFKIV